MLDSPSPVVEREPMREDDSTPSTDPIDSFVPDSVSRDIAELGQKRNLAWVHQTLQDDEGHAAPHGAPRERNIPHIFRFYVALMKSIFLFEAFHM